MSDISRDITEIARCCAQYKVDMLSPMGLKGCHASYLSEICAYPGISQDKLAQKICINKSNIARQAAALEEDGFITRRPSESDKRCMELYPTEKTLALMPQIEEILDSWDRTLLQDLSDSEQELLEQLQEASTTENTISCSFAEEVEIKHEYVATDRIMNLGYLAETLYSTKTAEVTYEVKRGDTVSLLDEELSVLWMADLLDCNVDEIVCGISKRVPRIYEY